MTMGVIFIGLLFKLIFKTPLKFRNIGVAITHLGSFLLIFGGIITGYMSFEGSMVLNEGETVSFFQDFHKLELAIIDSSPSEYDQVLSFSEAYLKKGKWLRHQNIEFKIKILDFCQNCTYEREVNPDLNFIGFRKNFRLKSIPLNKDDSLNRAGVTFKLSGSDLDGIYAIFENMQIGQSLHMDGKKYFIEIRKKHYNLPFKLKLLDFIKTDYASTRMAKSYKSVIQLIDGKVTQRTVVEMNEPLRFKGYTFYQSSFIQSGGKETTIFSVVHNIGRMFPYISSIIICIGLVLHLLVGHGFFLKKENEGDGK